MVNFFKRLFGAGSPHAASPERTPVRSGVARSYFSPREITPRYALHHGDNENGARRTRQFRFIRRTSNARTRIGGQQYAIDQQAAGSLGCTGNVSGIIMHARPMSIFWTTDESRLYRIKEAAVRCRQAPKWRYSAQYIPQTRDRNTSFQREFISPWRAAEEFFSAKNNSALRRLAIK